MLPMVTAMLTQMHTALRRLRRDLSGATAIEYAMIVLFIALTLIALLMSIGTTVSGFYNSAATGL